MVKFIGFLLFVVVLVDVGHSCCIYHPNCDHPKLMARMDQLEKKIDKLMVIAGNCSADAGNPGSGSACPKGWIPDKHSCFKLITAANTWNDARKACLAIGGDLVTIKSPQKNIYVANLALAHTKAAYVWIGLHRDPTTTKFKWIDGSSLSGLFTKWKPGEPSSVKEECGMMYINQANVFELWNDMSCTSKFPAMCERSIAQK